MSKKTSIFIFFIFSCPLCFISQEIDSLDSLNVENSPYLEDALEVLDFSDLEEPISDLEEPKEKKIDYTNGGNISMQNQFFIDSPIYPLQESYYALLNFSPEIKLSFGEGKNQEIVAEANANLGSSDDNRSYIDFPKLYYKAKIENHQLLVGNSVEFWGVTETSNPTNIINQQDFIQSPTGRDKLGQMMVKYTGDYTLGRLEMYYLPYTKSIRFSGIEGRFRPIIPIDNEPTFDEGLNRWTPGFATRFSKSLGAFDFALSYFNGIDRNPIFDLDIPNLNINQRYIKSEIYGVEFQATKDIFALKYEGIYNSNANKDFLKYVVGLESTHLGIFNTNANAIVIAEYIRNSQSVEQNPIQILSNDLSLGMRLDLNDEKSSNISFGGTYNLDKRGSIFFAQASSRIFENWVLSFDSAILSQLAPLKFITIEDYDQINDVVLLSNTPFSNLVIDDINTLERLFPLRREDFFTITITKYF